MSVLSSSFRPFTVHHSTVVTLHSKGKGGFPAFRFHIPGKKIWKVYESDSSVTWTTLTMVPEGQHIHKWDEVIHANTEIIRRSLNIWTAFNILQQQDSDIEVVACMPNKNVMIITNGIREDAHPFRTLLFIYDRCIFTLEYCSKKEDAKAACEAYLSTPIDINKYLEPPSSQYK